MVEVSYLNNLKVSLVFSETCLKPARLFKCPSGDIPLSDSGVGRSVGRGSSRKRLAAAMVRSYVTPLGKPRGCRGPRWVYKHENQMGISPRASGVPAMQRALMQARFPMCSIAI